jgi:hypothetical protein
MRIVSATLPRFCPSALLIIPAETPFTCVLSTSLSDYAISATLSKRSKVVPTIMKLSHGSTSCVQSDYP